MGAGTAVLQLGEEPKPPLEVSTQVLGAGAEGMVLLGRLRNVEVAVKRSRSPQSLAEEAQILRLCSSAFVAQLMEPELVQDTLVLELLGPVKVPAGPKAGWLMAYIFYGLAAIHGRSICHRDIKMENILRTATGRLKLADFGCASQVPEHGLFFGRAGSFKSWAPEVHALSSGYNAGYGGKSADVWSGGICSHEQICGRYPFRGRTPRETRQGITINQMKNKILAGPDPADPDLNVSRFRGIVLQLLHLDAGERPTAATAAAMISGLACGPAQPLKARGGDASQGLSTCVTFFLFAQVLRLRLPFSMFAGPPEKWNVVPANSMTFHWILPRLQAMTLSKAERHRRPMSQMRPCQRFSAQYCIAKKRENARLTRACHHDQVTCKGLMQYDILLPVIG